MSVVSGGGNSAVPTPGGTPGPPPPPPPPPAAAAAQRRTTVVVEEGDQSRRESKFHDPHWKRDHFIPDPPSKKESRAIQLQRNRGISLPANPGRPSHATRRQSIGGSHPRSGIYLNEALMRQVGLENTYRLTPLDPERFCASKVEVILAEVLHNFLNGEQYDDRKCSKMALQMTDIVKERVKELNFRRHRLSCHVIVGQKMGQGLQISSRCLWDAKQDGSASAIFGNASLFAVATVFAVYYE